MRAGRRLLLLSGLLALTATCQGSDHQGSAPGTVRIDMSTSAYLSTAALHIALQEGYFADEGIEVHLHPATESGSTSLPALDRGRLAVGTMPNLIALANTIDHGGNVRVVAGATFFAADKCSYSGLVARKGLFREGEPITPASLRGKRIDLNPLSFEGFFLDTFLARGGLSLDDIDQVYVPLAARMEAMSRGAIDLTVISEPWLTRLAEAGHPVVLRVNEVLPDLQSSTLVFGSRLLDEDRETGRRFVAAYVRAARQLNQGPTPRNVEIAGGFTRLDAETLKRMCWPTMREDGRIETERILEYQRWALGKGHIERIVGIDELFDPYFTEALRNERAAGGGR